MEFLAEKRLSEILQHLEAKHSKEQLDKLHDSIKLFRRDIEQQRLDKDETKFRWNLAVYSLHILSDLNAPIPVLAAGFLIDTYLRLSSCQEIDSFPVDELVRQFLSNAARLYKYELQLPWRKTNPTSDLEQNVLRFLRKRAIADTELPNESLQSAKKQHENHRKLIVSLAATWEILIIKLADRIAVLNFLKAKDEDVTSGEMHTLLNNMAKETLNIHVPITERLGIWILKWPLQDMAFRINCPKEYEKISSEMATKREAGEHYLKDIIQNMITVLESYGIKTQVQGRFKSLYSIYRKQITQNKKIDNINDLVGVRIITKSKELNDGGNKAIDEIRRAEDKITKFECEINRAMNKLRKIKRETRKKKTRYGMNIIKKEIAGIKNEINNAKREIKRAEHKIKNAKHEINMMKADDCYDARDLILSTWPPPVNENGQGIYDGESSRDWIVNPKPNKYQSIHTTILYPLAGGKQQLVEVQIRTSEMHEVAELGVAAHWLYKEKGKSFAAIEKNDELWNREQKKLKNDVEPRDETIGSFFEEEIFCLTPKGEVLQLPKDATPIDFAYHVHRDIGNRMMNVKVNNRIASFSYQLKNGDVVGIVLSKTEKGPKQEWLRQDNGFVKSKSTGSKIRQWFRQHIS